MTDPTGLNTKVATLITDFTDQLGRMAGLNETIRNIRGPDLLTLGDLKSDLVAIRAAQADFFGNAAQLLAALSASVGLLDEGSTDTALKLLFDIRDHIGFPTGDATTTLLGLLLAMSNLLRCGCPPGPPNLTGGDAPCSDPYTSRPELNRSIAQYPGRVFAGWPSPPPTGLILQTWLETPNPPAEISWTSSDLGRRIYVQSEARTFNANPFHPNQFPTNVWVDFDDQPDDMAISVDAAYNLTVYICVPSPVAWTDCIDITSEFCVYSTDQPFSLDVQAVRFNTVPTLVSTDTWSNGGVVNSMSTDNTVCTSDMFGVTIHFLSGTNTRIHWVTTDNQDGDVTLSMGESTFTMIVHTRAFVIANFTDPSASAHPFTIQICPPGD